MSATAAVTASQTILQRHDNGGVTTLTLNRPEQFNALSTGMLDALQTALDDINDDASIRVVVIGANGKAFCPGHDLKEMLANRTQPVIARVHGIATAAGCQLVASCDLAVASTEARFATSGINFGLYCATPGVALSRTITRKRAMEMLMTGEFIDAATALEWGLINRVAPPDKLDDAVQELAQLLVGKPPAVLAAGKKFFYRQIEMELAPAYKLATQVITENMLGADALEGVGAFIEKRAPRWRTS
jgi:enoyl-CoA hydratase/carnithine racemase